MKGKIKVAALELHLTVISKRIANFGEEYIRINENRKVMKPNLKGYDSSRSYAMELKQLIEERTGKECEPWLYPQIRSTARNELFLDKIQDELYNGQFVQPALGSIGQLKSELNPLVAMFDKVQRTLLAQFESLGLNYNSTPRKITDNTKQGGSEQDTLKSLLEDAKD